jgi:hypothetical protein
MDEQSGINLKSEILARYGTVRRAYDYHLYTSKGVRLLDLCQEGGAAILGWRAGRAKLAFKNLLDRGITGNFPTDIEDELVRAVQEVLPQYGIVRWYQTRERARLACASFLGLWSDLPLIESPLLHPEASVDIGPAGDSPLSAARQVYGVPVWRPWLDEAYYAMGDRLDSAFLRTATDTLHTMVLSSPLPFAGGATLAVFASGNPESPDPLPSDPVSPALLGALARSFSDLSAALCERTDADWAKFDRYIEPFWDRRGPYLVPKMRKSRYPDFFRSCLDKGFLVSPEYDTPSIVPYTADPGEFRRLVRENTRSTAP